jgi:hypothetical protein
MTRSLAIVAALIAAFAVASPAQAAPKSCQRDGAKLLAAGGSVRVVSVKQRAQNSETRRDRIYGCWTATGRRFTLFVQRDFGLDLIERAQFEIVDARYIGAIRQFEGGVSESLSAATWDAQKHRLVHDSKPCDEVSAGDLYGVQDAVFFHGGGMAYTCWGHIHLADARGDRELEPAGTRVTQLGISRNGHGAAERLYYLIDDSVMKTVGPL